MAEFPDHKVLVIGSVTYANGTGVRAVDFEPVALVGLDCRSCRQQDGKMHLFDACLGMGKKLFDKPISDTFTPTIFLHINREDVASVSRSSIRQDIEAPDTDQAATFKSTKDRSAQPMAIRRYHRVAALVFFGGNQRIQGASEAPPREFREEDPDRRQSVSGFPHPPEHRQQVTS